MSAPRWQRRLARANLFAGLGTALYARFGCPTVAAVHRDEAAMAARDLPHGARALDVGSGPGDFLLRLAEARSDVTLVGVDPARAAVRLAQRRVRRAGCPRLRMVLGAAERLPFPDAWFAHAWSIATIKHWTSPARGLVEIARVLIPGARLTVIELDPEAGDERLRAVPGRFPEYTHAVLRRAVLPSSLPRACVRALLRASPFTIERDELAPDLPFYGFVLRR